MSTKLTVDSNGGTVGRNDYVPAMRWKAGEMRAINRLIKDGQADNVFPIFLIDNDKERAQNETSRIPTTPTSYIDFIASEMQKTVDTSRIAFVDTHLFDSKQDEDGLVLFFSTLFAKLTKLIPVVRISDKQSRRSQIQNTATERGVALRLAERHIEHLNEIDVLLTDLGIDETSADLILDLEFLDDVRADSKPFAERIETLFRKTKRWRSFVLLSGAYPAKVSLAQVNHKRFDWLSHEAFRLELERRQLRVPTFGDYGIINPNVKPTSGSGTGGGGKPIIRYCTTDSWEINRSVDAPKAGSVSPYFELARICATSPHFMGAGFSYGDAYIDSRAIGGTSSGGQSLMYIVMDWIHHLRHAAAQASGELPKPCPRALSEVKPPSAYEQNDDELWEL